MAQRPKVVEVEKDEDGPVLAQPTDPTQQEDALPGDDAGVTVTDLMQMYGAVQIDLVSANKKIQAKDQALRTYKNIVRDLKARIRDLESK